MTTQEFLNHLNANYTKIKLPPGPHIAFNPKETRYLVSPPNMKLEASGTYKAIQAYDGQQLHWAATSLNVPNELRETINGYWTRNPKIIKNGLNDDDQWQPGGFIWDEDKYRVTIITFDPSPAPIISIPTPTKYLIYSSKEKGYWHSEGAHNPTKRWGWGPRQGATIYQTPVMDYLTPDSRYVRESETEGLEEKGTSWTNVQWEGINTHPNARATSPNPKE